MQIAITCANHRTINRQTKYNFDPIQTSLCYHYFKIINISLSTFHLLTLPKDLIHDSPSLVVRFVLCSGTRAQKHPAFFISMKGTPACSTVTISN